LVGQQGQVEAAIAIVEGRCKIEAVTFFLRHVFLRTVAAGAGSLSVE
jgi:hypothetical protein